MTRSRPRTVEHPCANAAPPREGWSGVVRGRTGCGALQNFRLTRVQRYCPFMCSPELL